MTRFVVRIGGSVIASPPDPELMEKYVNLLKDLKEQGHEFVVVVGGGCITMHFTLFTVNGLVIFRFCFRSKAQRKTGGIHEQNHRD